jgi:hypothetical protein
MRRNRRPLQLVAADLDGKHAPAGLPPTLSVNSTTGSARSFEHRQLR